MSLTKISVYVCKDCLMAVEAGITITILEPDEIDEDQADYKEQKSPTCPKCNAVLIGPIKNLKGLYA